MLTFGFVDNLGDWLLNTVGHFDLGPHPPLLGRCRTDLLFLSEKKHRDLKERNLLYEHLTKQCMGRGELSPVTTLNVT